MKHLKSGLMLLLIVSSLLYGGSRVSNIILSGNLIEASSQHLSVDELTHGLKYVSERVYNPYEKRTDIYGGVLIDEFVQKYANENTQSIELIAIDDYSITITKDEWKSMRIILSTEINNKKISIKNKGPLRIVFPDYDPQETQYQTNIASWIWMIKKIKFK